ncbi:hypothetical protein [Lentilactobacillus senioris]|uniref:hypothetical protein n=1 Tax=Lentilactobacillus senioris TaxID=931534 RepID=UPI000ABEB831|nr:hypothetical protein [Lentilactobacillus senioris]
MGVASHKETHEYNTNYQLPMDNFVNDQEGLTIIGKEKLTNGEWQGLVQVLFEKHDSGSYEFAGIRPIRITETAFLTKATGINWVRVLVKKYLTGVDLERLKQDLQLRLKPNRYATMTGRFPFGQLGARRMLGGLVPKKLALLLNLNQ